MLPKINRLKLEKDFRQTFSEGKIYRTKSLTLRLRHNRGRVSRFGFVISNKVAKNAVVRNRLRRQLSEIVGLNLINTNQGYDIVLIAGTGLLRKSFNSLKTDVEMALKEAGIIV